MDKKNIDNELHSLEEIEKEFKARLDKFMLEEMATLKEKQPENFICAAQLKVMSTIMAEIASKYLRAAKGMGILFCSISRIIDTFMAETMKKEGLTENAELHAKLKEILESRLSKN